MLVTAGWTEEELANANEALQNRARRVYLQHAAVAASHATASAVVLARALSIPPGVVYRWRHMYKCARRRRHSLRRITHSPPHRSIADAAIAWAASDPRPSPFDASLMHSPRPPPPPTPSLRASAQPHTFPSRYFPPPCLHCSSRPPTALSLPCAHVVVCETCATRVARCPQCHADIERAFVRRRLCSRSPRKRCVVASPLTLVTHRSSTPAEANEAPAAEPSEETGPAARQRFLEQQVHKFRDLYLQACRDAGMAPSV